MLIFLARRILWVILNITIYINLFIVPSEGAAVENALGWSKGLFCFCH